MRRGDSYPGEWMQAEAKAIPAEPGGNLHVRRKKASDLMTLELHRQGIDPRGEFNPASAHSEPERKWFAVFTLPQNEKSAVKQLALREVEAFLPTYETVNLWKNRQRVRTVLPLFPTYLFVRIDRRQRGKVLQVPGVIAIVGSSREDVAVPDAEIELLRTGVKDRTLEPFRELVAGTKVRIKSGSMEGVEGVLVRKGNGFKFVLALKLINQHAAIEIGGEDLEPVAD